MTEPGSARSCLLLGLPAVEADTWTRIPEAWTAEADLLALCEEEDDGHLLGRQAVQLLLDDEASLSMGERAEHR